MNHAALNELVDAILETGFASVGELRGCTEEDVERVRQFAGGTIPAIYEEFLRRMGRAAGRYSGDVDFLFPVILDLRESAEMLVAEQGLELPRHYFVFSMLNECAFLCFDPRIDDPAVQRFVEGADDFVTLGSLSSFFRREAAGLRPKT